MPEKQTRVPPPGSRDAQKKTDEEPKEFRVPAIGDTQNGLAALFNLLSRVLGSETRFEDREFEDEARAATNLGRKIRQIAFALTLLAPLVVVLSLWLKIERIRAGIRPRQEGPNDQPHVPVMGWMRRWTSPPAPGDMHASANPVAEPTAPASQPREHAAASPESGEAAVSAAPTPAPVPFVPSSAGRAPGVSGIVKRAAALRL